MRGRCVIVGGSRGGIGGSGGRVPRSHGTTAISSGVRFVMHRALRVSGNRSGWGEGGRTAVPVVTPGRGAYCWTDGSSDQPVGRIRDWAAADG
jgi:hypothetical protein